LKPILKTDRLILREFTLNDLDNLYLLDSSLDVMKYIGKLRTREEVERSIERVKKYYINNPGLGLWITIEKKSEKFIGWSGIQHLDETEIEVGYRYLKEFWGKGYATEAATFLVDYGFNKMNLNKIVGVTHPDNIASQRVLEKAGLKYEKEAFYHETNVRYYTINKNHSSSRGTACPDYTSGK